MEETSVTNSHLMPLSKISSARNGLHLAELLAKWISWTSTSNTTGTAKATVS